MSEQNQHSEHFFGGPYGWQDIESDSRMEFATLEDLTSFLNWKSGRLEEQLETAEARANAAEAFIVRMDMAYRYEEFRLADPNPASSPTKTDSPYIPRPSSPASVSGAGGASGSADLGAHTEYQPAPETPAQSPAISPEAE